MLAFPLLPQATYCCSVHLWYYDSNTVAAYTHDIQTFAHRDPMDSHTHFELAATTTLLLDLPTPMIPLVRT